METWLSYDLSDLLMFSPRVYYRQLELANAAAWPLHLVTIAAGLVLAWCVALPTPVRNRIAAAVLAAAFASSCLLYVWPAYAEIHVAGSYMAALFLGQAAALAGLALPAGGLNIRPGGRLLTWCRMGLMVLITLAYPALAIMSGRSIASAEVFGIAADPTALAALIVIATGARGWQLLLAVPPWLWLAFSASSLWVMDAPEVWIILPALLAAPAMMLAVWGRSRK
jgi:hypothetical protein